MAERNTNNPSQLLAIKSPSILKNENTEKLLVELYGFNFIEIVVQMKKKCPLCIFFKVLIIL